MARRFTRWEVRNVFCHKNGYEDFRDQVICLDYNELLEMYVEETVHPAVRPHGKALATTPTSKAR